jgi:ferrous iron transport protein A
MVPLGLLQLGDRAEVVEIVPGKHPGARMEDLGFRAGKTVEMLNNGGRGPLLVKIDESRLALGRGMAMKIMVRRSER